MVLVGNLAGIFSTFGAAMGYARSAGEPAIIYPMRVNDPGWGNSVVQ